jgi:hypothetical protein
MGSANGGYGQKSMGTGGYTGGPTMGSGGYNGERMDSFQQKPFASPATIPGGYPGPTPMNRYIPPGIPGGSPGPVTSEQYSPMPENYGGGSSYNPFTLNQGLFGLGQTSTAVPGNSSTNAPYIFGDARFGSSAPPADGSNGAGSAATPFAGAGDPPEMAGGTNYLKQKPYASQTGLLGGPLRY